MKLIQPYSHLVYWRRKVFRPRKVLSKPVISVGNIAFGGTGKTPLVMKIAEEYMHLGLKVSILSRGYMRKSKGTVVVSDGEGVVSTVKDAGEEAFMMAKMLKKAVVIVDKNRYRAGKFAEDEFKVDLHVLDDGFQHLSLARDLDIVCLPASVPRSHGMLREPFKALNYADMIVFTGRGRHSTIDKWRSYFTSSFRHADTYHLPMVFQGFYNRENKPIDRSWVLDQPWVGVTGIARPGRFQRRLKKLKISVKGMFTFPDHHWPTKKDVTTVTEFINMHNLRGIITTDKDIHKWTDMPGEIISVRIGYAPLPGEMLEILKGIAGL